MKAVPRLTDEVVLLLDQPLAPRATIQRLTVTASFCRFYRRGCVTVYLPPGVDRDQLDRFEAVQPFEHTSAAVLKVQAQKIFDNLLGQLKQQRQLKEDINGLQLRFEL